MQIIREYSDDNPRDISARAEAIRFVLGRVAQPEPSPVPEKPKATGTTRASAPKKEKAR